MADSQATFNTVISATDKTGPVVAKLRGEIAAVAKQSGELGAVTRRLGLSGVFSRMRGAVTGATGAVRTMRGEVESLGGKLTSLVPGLAGLSCLAGVGGIFKLTADVAESAEKFGNLAASLGITRAQLGGLNFLAKQTGVDTEAMATGFERFEPGFPR